MFFFIDFAVFFQLSASLTLKKSLFGSTPKKHLEAPFLYQWLGKLQDALVSKVIFTQFYVTSAIAIWWDLDFMSELAIVDTIPWVGGGGEGP